MKSTIYKEVLKSNHISLIIKIVVISTLASSLVSCNRSETRSGWNHTFSDSDSGSSDVVKGDSSTSNGSSSSSSDGKDDSTSSGSSSGSNSSGDSNSSSGSSSSSSGSSGSSSSIGSSSGSSGSCSSPTTVNNQDCIYYSNMSTPIYDAVRTRCQDDPDVTWQANGNGCTARIGSSRTFICTTATLALSQTEYSFDSSAEEASVLANLCELRGGSSQILNN